MSIAIPTPETITAEFFSEVLRASGHAGARVAAFEAAPVGTGQVGLCIRFALSYAEGAADAPRTLVGKFPSRDPR